MPIKADSLPACRLASPNFWTFHPDQGTAIQNTAFLSYLTFFRVWFSSLFLSNNLSAIALVLCLATLNNIVGVWTVLRATENTSVTCTHLPLIAYGGLVSFFMIIRFDLCIRSSIQFPEVHHGTVVGGLGRIRTECQSTIFITTWKCPPTEEYPLC